MSQLKTAFLLMIVVLLFSCGGGGQTLTADPDSEQPAQQEPETPITPTLKESQGTYDERLGLPKPSGLVLSHPETDDCYQQGSQYVAELPNDRITVDGDSLLFDFTGAQEEDLAYAAFVINMERHANTENPYVYLDWEDMYFDFLGVIWIGLANFETNEWEWMETHATATDAELRSEAKIASPNESPYVRENLLVAVVVGEAREKNIGEKYRLENVSAGGIQPLTKLYTPIATTGGMTEQFGYAHTERTFMASGFLASEPCTYRWEFGAAGGSEGISGTSPVEIMLGAAGEYPVSVTVSNAYGPPLVLPFVLTIFDQLPGSWAKVWPQAKYESITVAEDGSIYVTGYAHENGRGGGIFMARITPQGTLIWAKEFFRVSTAADNSVDQTQWRLPQRSNTFRVTPIGGKGVILACGATYLKDEGPDDEAVLLVRINQGGELEWSRSWSKVSTGRYVVGVSPAGDIVTASCGKVNGQFDTDIAFYSATGEFRQGLRLDTVSSYITPHDLNFDQSGALYISGGIGVDDPNSRVGPRPTATVALKLSPGGTIDYIRYFGLLRDSPKSQVLADGSLFLAGTTGYVEDAGVVFPQMMVARLDPQGEVMMCRYLDHPGASTLTSLAMAGDGSLVLGGYTGTGPSSLPGVIYDSMAAQCTADGELLGAGVFHQSEEWRGPPSLGVANGKLYIGAYADSPFGAWQDLDLSLHEIELSSASAEYELTNFTETEYPAELTVTDLMFSVQAIMEGWEPGPMIACRPTWN